MTLKLLHRSLCLRHYKIQFTFQRYWCISGCHCKLRIKARTGEASCIFIAVHIEMIALSEWGYFSLFVQERRPYWLFPQCLETQNRAFSAASPACEIPLKRSLYVYFKTHLSSCWLAGWLAGICGSTAISAAKIMPDPIAWWLQDWFEIQEILGKLSPAHSLPLKCSADRSLLSPNPQSLASRGGGLIAL